MSAIEKAAESWIKSENGKALPEEVKSMAEHFKRVVGEEMPALIPSSEWEDGYNTFRSELLGDA